MIGVILNDAQFALNPTRLASVERPRTTADVSDLIQQAAAAGQSISIAGARHSMGGQQFGEGTLNLDMRGMADIVTLDDERGIVEVRAAAHRTIAARP